jgi:DNA-binding NtrC family response regulator
MAKIYRILFIDDEKIITSMAEIFLESAGFEVEAFNDHTAALEVFMLDPARFHLVVTDQTMRGATGMEIAAKIKAVRPAIPIIMITGYHGNLTATKAKEAGINQILYKPVVPRDLALAIRKELDAEG